jgi:hypothetical protein
MVGDEREAHPPPQPLLCLRALSLAEQERDEKQLEKRIEKIWERREAHVIECPEASASKMRMQVRDLLEVLQERFLPHFEGGCLDE